MFLVQKGKSHPKINWYYFTNQCFNSLLTQLVDFLISSHAHAVYFHSSAVQIGYCLWCMILKADTLPRDHRPFRQLTEQANKQIVCWCSETCSSPSTTKGHSFYIYSNHWSVRNIDDPGQKLDCMSKLKSAKAGFCFAVVVFFFFHPTQHSSSNQKLHLNQHKARTLHHCQCKFKLNTSVICVTDVQKAPRLSKLHSWLQWDDTPHPHPKSLPWGNITTSMHLSQNGYKQD